MLSRNARMAARQALPLRTSTLKPLNGNHIAQRILKNQMNFAVRPFATFNRSMALFKPPSGAENFANGTSAVYVD